GGITAWEVEAGDESVFDRITARDEDDRYRRARGLGRCDRQRISSGEGDGDPPTHEVGRESWQTIEMIVRGPVLDRQIPSFDETHFTQALAKSAQQGLVPSAGVQISDRCRTALLLPRDGGACQSTAKSCDECSPSHALSLALFS